MPKPYLGIYLETASLKQSAYQCREDVFIKVAGVIGNTPASEAGIMKDDIIISVNGLPVCGETKDVISAFKKTIAGQPVGSVISIGVQRDNSSFLLPVSLREAPMHDNPEASHPEIGACNEGPSKLENVLRSQDGLPLLGSISDGLYLRSNTVHNPGSFLAKTHPLQLRELTYIMRHPLAAGEAANGLSERLYPSIHDRGLSLGRTMQRAASLLDIDLQRPSGQAAAGFPDLIQILTEAKRTVEDAVSDLTPQEKALLWDSAFHYEDDENWNSISKISMKVDRKNIIGALTPLFYFLDHDNLALLREDIIRRFGRQGAGQLYEAMTPIGKVIVGGEGPDVYNEDAALILDIGGDDLYRNNAGGNRPGMPVAMVIDWGGDDRYISRDNLSQGAAVLGGGLLVDLGGNDTFVANDGSQGAAFWGAAVLYHGDGSSDFSARSFSQGIGRTGMGLLANGRGDDRYICLYSGQGLGLFGGAGILMDESGNDLYRLGGLVPDFRDPAKSTVSLGQGFGKGVMPEKDNDGVPGGIGMLIDASGDDSYIADYFGQGASYYYGIGILDDRSGNDQYTSGRYSQGAGIHSSVGVLVDRQGDDFYYASFGVGQGTGHDMGIGFFEDRQGDDICWGGTLVQGASTNGSLGIFIDPSGDNRKMHVGQGQGYAEDDTGMGIVIGSGPEEDRVSVRPGR